MEMTAIAKSLYDQLLSEVGALGTVRVEEKRTSIHLKRGAAFGGVHPRKSSLILTIVSATPIASPRVFKQERISKNRVHNEVRIEQTEDIDAELLGWLRAGYDLLQ